MAQRDRLILRRRLDAAWRRRVGERQIHILVEIVIAAGPEHPIRVVLDPRTGEPSPYVHVRDRLEALIARPVYYELVDRGVEVERDNKRVFGVWSKGQFFALGSLDGDT